uniref:Mitochondrial import inner membrane translocase subunit tim17 tim22 tim23 family protein n=1 Tax=Tetraselmis sp. GSL018 TaxID=582737 RepID=A0A061SL25_9CHLO|mmetsp:Transcript_26917/g.63889  ORF Transcript_26917/g.63889 Transcript_26917/m.63889 type:complete len:236 (-) Transcript_26917:351-1058(-)
MPNYSIEGGASSADESLSEPMPLPCFFKGIEAGISGGILGYIFGLGSKMFLYREGGGLKARWGAAVTEAGSTARTFASFGAIYAAAMCYTRRLRNVEDPWNGAIAGCATGLAVGYRSGTLAAAQSCLGIGAISFYLEKIGAVSGVQAAQAMGPSARTVQPPPHTWDRLHGPISLLLRPAVPILHSCTACGGGCELGLFHSPSWPLAGAMALAKQSWRQQDSIVGVNDTSENATGS